MNGSEPKEWTYCAVCGIKYGFIKCRVSYWEGVVRKENCLSCSILREKALSTPGPRRFLPIDYI